MSNMREKYPMFGYQQVARDQWLEKRMLANLSDPGTGKTRITIEAILEMKKQGHLRQAWVLAPLSLLGPAWANDIKKWTPELSVDIAHGKNRDAILTGSKADVVMINHDGVNAISKLGDAHKRANVLVVDESTAFKNGSAARTKIAMGLSGEFEFATILSGTPTPQGILDIWSQIYLLDQGQRLGKSYWNFRSKTCAPSTQTFGQQQVTSWKELPHAREWAMTALSDILFRVPLANVPKNFVRPILEIDLPKAVQAQYDALARQFKMEIDSGKVDAVNAASLHRKLLQFCTGTIYGVGQEVAVHEERYRLVTDLIEARGQCVVAFNFKHERDFLTKLAKSKGITFGVIDGDTPVKVREQVVDAFQSGKIQVVYAHPQSAGHGLTLTAGTATIWASPTYNAEHFVQFNRRIHRTGQTQETETIRIAARNTIEAKVYEKLEGKLEHLTYVQQLAEILSAS